MQDHSRALIRFVILGGIAVIFAQSFWPYVVGILALCGAFHIWTIYLKKK
jgi:hypothetical protein